MLYLTSFMPPTFGALLGVDLTKPELEPQVSGSFPPNSVHGSICMQTAAANSPQLALES